MERTERKEGLRSFALGASEAEAWLPQLTALDELIFPGHPWGEETFRKNAENSYDTLLLCAEADRLLGFGILRLLGDGEILLIGVEPAERRRGIGRRLLEELLERAGEAAVFLEVRESNKGAKALYESCGFRVTGRRKDYYEHPREDAVLMERRGGGP